MGTSLGSTIIHAAISCFINSSCPTQRIGNSSGCARCSVTPSKLTVRNECGSSGFMNLLRNPLVNAKEGGRFDVKARHNFLGNNAFCQMTMDCPILRAKLSTKGPILFFQRKLLAILMVLAAPIVAGTLGYSYLE